MFLSSRQPCREIELEYISALANDTALHIEEVIELIDTFTISEIRERIDDIFDPLTTQLVQCGQTCLKRLASLVMSDVQGKCCIHVLVSISRQCAHSI
jgi:Glu-tRNA(Gln) amidotransferase subunit E-like FAD-binding protein